MRWRRFATVGRLLSAWATVVVFAIFGDAWLAEPEVSIGTAILFVWLLAIISWFAFGVIEQADHVPAVLGIGPVTGQTVVLGVDPARMVLLAVTLANSMLTFSGSPTTVLEGAVWLFSP